MNAPDTVATIDPLGALRERKRLFDDVWLLTLFAIFLAVATPWFLRLLNVSLAPLAWSLFGFGVLQVAGAVAADRMQTGRRLLFVISALQAIGIAFLGWVWHLSGGLQNPMFLLVFVLPVVAGSLALPGWQSFISVVLAVATVGIVALMEAPELRWHLLQTGLPLEGLVKRLPETASPTTPFPTLNAPVSYLFVILALFAILLAAVALMTETVNALVLRLYRRLESSVAALDDARNRSLGVLEASPFPTALVYRDTFRVEQASHSFLHDFQLSPESLTDGNLFDLIKFSYPDVVEALIRGPGGELPTTAYKVGSETRVARIRVDPIDHGGTCLAHVVVEDISDRYYLMAAFSAAEEALLVIGADGRMRYFNQSAATVFEALAIGVEAVAVLDQHDLPHGWWAPGLRSRIERDVAIAGKRYCAHCMAVEIPGEREKLTIVRLRSLEQHP